jgi:hypothetical protein
VSADVFADSPVASIDSRNFTRAMAGDARRASSFQALFSKTNSRQRGVQKHAGPGIFERVSAFRLSLTERFYAFRRGSAFDPCSPRHMGNPDGAV